MSKENANPGLIGKVQQKPSWKLTQSPLAYFKRSGWLGHRVVYRETVGSTNDLALDLALNGAGEGLVILADEQTAGRGRLNRRWSAPSGVCLLMSLVFRPQAEFQEEARKITMACGLALRDAIREQTAVPVWLKWPNDVIVIRQNGWGKVAGMLSEVGLDQGYPKVLVVGIGINVNVPDETLSQLAPNAASLLVEAGVVVDRSVLLELFLSRLEKYVDTLRSGRDVLDVWRSALAWMGQPVVVTLPTGAITGIAESVDNNGALIMTLSDGSRRTVIAGDISLRPAAT